MRAPDCGSRLDLLTNVVPVQGQILRQPLDDALRPGLAALPGPVQLGGQARRCRVLQVTEQVNADALMLARDLDPANEGDPVMQCGGGGLLPTRGGVVIGQSQNIHAGLGRGVHHLGR